MYNIIIMIYECLFDWYPSRLLNCQLIVVLTETNNCVVFLYRVGAVVQPFLPLQSAKPSSIIILESRELVGCLRKLLIVPLIAQQRWYKISFQKCWHQVTDVPDEVIGRRSGYQGTDASLLIYSIDCCVVVASIKVVTMITQGISRHHQLHRPISVTSVFIFSLLGYVHSCDTFSNGIYKLSSPSFITKVSHGTVSILYY